MNAMISVRAMASASIRRSMARSRSGTHRVDEVNAPPAMTDGSMAAAQTVVTAGSNASTISAPRPSRRRSAGARMASAR